MSAKIEYTADEIAKVRELRAKSKTWREIGVLNAVRGNHASIRNYCVNVLGMPAYLPGSKGGVKRATPCPKWARYKERRAARAAAASHMVWYGDYRLPLFAGSPETWGAISAHPWPGYGRIAA